MNIAIVRCGLDIGKKYLRWLERITLNIDIGDLILDIILLAE